MKKNSSVKINPITVILCLLALIFLGYGIYMVFDSIEYVNSYSNSSVTAENAMQYIVTSTMAYFGFSVTFFIGAYISQMLYSLKLSLTPPVPTMIQNKQDRPEQQKFSEQNESLQNHKKIEEANKQEKIVSTENIKTEDTKKAKKTEEIKETGTITETKKPNEEENHTDMISSSMIKNIFEKK